MTREERSKSRMCGKEVEEEESQGRVADDESSLSVTSLVVPLAR